MPLPLNKVIRLPTIKLPRYTPISSKLLIITSLLAI